MYMLTLINGQKIVGLAVLVLEKKWFGAKKKKYEGNVFIVTKELENM